MCQGHQEHVSRGCGCCCLWWRSFRCTWKRQQSDTRFDFFNAHVEYAKVERVAVKSSLMNTLWCCSLDWFNVFSIALDRYTLSRVLSETMRVVTALGRMLSVLRPSRCTRSMSLGCKGEWHPWHCLRFAVYSRGLPPVAILQCPWISDWTYVCIVQCRQFCSQGR